MSDATGTIASIATAIGVLCGVYQLRLSRRSALSAFESRFVERYEDLLTNLPDDVVLEKAELEHPTDRQLRTFHDYFALCDEEIFYRRDARVSRATWRDWERGIQLNLKRPTFVFAWAKLLENEQLGDRFGDLASRVDKLKANASTRTNCPGFDGVAGSHHDRFPPAHTQARAFQPDATVLSTVSAPRSGPTKPCTSFLMSGPNSEPHIYVLGEVEEPHGYVKIGVHYGKPSQIGRSGLTTGNWRELGVLYHHPCPRKRSGGTSSSSTNTFVRGTSAVNGSTQDRCSPASEGGASCSRQPFVATFPEVRSWTWERGVIACK
ncbi:MAG: hypothetical protein AB7R77_14520 [Ilumatobacteraceae bacterium]